MRRRMRVGERSFPAAVVRGPVNQRLHLNLFVSYEDEEAQDLAVRAKIILENAGHAAWVWCRDAKSGAYTHEEISENIRGCHRMVYICTPASHASIGQRYERAQALTWERVIDVVAFALDDISGEIRHANAKITAPERYDQTCMDLGEEFAYSPLPGVGPDIGQGESVI